MIRAQLNQAHRVMAGRGFRQEFETDRVSPQGGFTLVEMLVSVTLVLLMMVMFGEIFQIATNSVTKQRVTADNDQNTRTFVTVIRGDLENRSCRVVVPFFANEAVDGNAFPPLSDREGYFSISNNSLVDAADDVLQFTAALRDDDAKFYGRATALPGNFFNTTNQPERDDSQIVANEAGASRAAEISYWLRAGKLYRRVMLVRDPPQNAGSLPAEPYQPRTTGGQDYFRIAGAAPLYTGNVWGDFDYSAHRLPSAFVVPPLTASFAIFNGAYDASKVVDYMKNDKPPLTGAPGLWTASLGQPWNRFGHNHEIVVGSTQNGFPREFSAMTAPNFFIGRFTHEETSDTNFRYPHLPAVGLGPAGNPMDGDTSTTPANALLDSSPRDGVVDQFASGNRVGVDLLLSNVHEFRVEVWDERLLDFAPIGHSRTTAGIAGDYHVSRRLNSTYGPLGGQANVLDTWHPRLNRNANLDGGGNPILGDEPDRPPYRPLNFDPTGFSGLNPTATNPSGNGPYWAPNTSYQVGDLIFPLPGEDLNFNGFLDPGEDGANGFPADGLLQEKIQISPLYPIGMITDDVNGDGMLGMGEDGSYGFPADGNPNVQSLHIPYYPMGLTLAYRCVGSRTSDPAAVTFAMSGPNRLHQPNWSASVGQRMRQTEDLNGNGTLELGEDVNGNGVLDYLDWVVDYNVRPLRAIRITVRFEHPSSKQMKQVTIVQSLRDVTSAP